ncbi:uncharacterized [Tachysurus ichikawai]
MAPYLASAGGAPSGPCQMLGTAVACMEKRVCTAAAVSTASLPSAQNKRAYIVLAFLEHSETASPFSPPHPLCSHTHIMSQSELGQLVVGSRRVSAALDEDKMAWTQVFDMQPSLMQTPSLCS